MLGHVRRWLCMSQEERLGQNLTQLELHLGLLSYQNCEKQISLVKLPSQGILLCRPEKSFAAFDFSYFHQKGRML